MVRPLPVTAIGNGDGMIVVSYGMIKSASTFVFQISSDILKRRSQEEDVAMVDPSELDARIVANFVPGNVDLSAIVEKLLERQEAEGVIHAIVKSHVECPKRIRGLLDDGEIVATASFRHPAEVALSLIDAAINDRKQNRGRFDEYDTWDAAVAQLPYQARCFQSWVESKSVLPVYYDDVASNPLEAMRKVSNLLDYQGPIESIVLPYLENKSKIAEFNKGILKRREEELSADAVEGVESALPGLMRYVWAAM
jgi:hypothetical protein